VANASTAAKMRVNTTSQRSVSMPALMLNKSTSPRMSMRIPSTSGTSQVRRTQFGKSSRRRESPGIAVDTSAPFTATKYGFIVAFRFGYAESVM
jgi:hypothetical protein